MRRPAGGRRDPAALPPRRLSSSAPTICAWCRRWSRQPCAANGPSRADESASLERFDLPERHPDLPRCDRGAGLPDRDGRLRHVLQLLHRSGHAWARDQPAGCFDSRRGRVAGGPRSPRADPAGADRQRLRPPRPAARSQRRSRHRRLRRAAAAAGRDSGDRTAALHEPAPALLRRRPDTRPRANSRSSALTSICRSRAVRTPSWQRMRRRYTAARLPRAGRRRCARPGPTSRSPPT